MQEKIKQLHAEGGFNTADNARLGIPGFIMADGPHGVRDGFATSFPVGIGMASTWDVELAKRIGTAMGKEFRGKGKHQALGPALDLDRDPRNGRSAETGGEDPYLCAQITTAVVQGIQSTPCLATIKHYNVNHREIGRTTNNIFATQRILHDEAGLAFRTAVQQGGAMSVMNAYTLINGQKCAENSNLLTTILRTHWGFPFYVVSDWGSIWSAERAIKAGCDICMGSDDYKNNLPSLVANGTVSQATIDEAVRRVLRTKILAGMLDYLPPGDPSDVNSKAHQLLCLEAGRKSLVLLKNEGGILPLNRNTIRTIALIGPSAATARIDGSGSAYVTPFYSISPRQGLEAKLGSSAVLFSKGCDINSADTSGFAAAVALARSSDVVVFCGGLDPSQEGEGFDRVGGSLELPGRQQELLNALSAANRNTVAVIFSGGVCGLSRCISGIRGLIYAFYPGQEGGNALADVLFGDYNPGGRMPVTMPKSDSQLPPWNDDLTDDYGAGYRWFDRMGLSPEFAFGSGLSFTTFSYSNLVLTPRSAPPGVPINVSVDVRNTGQRTGDEVVQLYLTHPPTATQTAIKQLKAFRRVGLNPGETSTITMTLTADELYSYSDVSSSYEVISGEFMIRVGGSSDNLPLTASVQIQDGPRKPDLFITSIRMVPPYPVPGQSVVFLATVKNQGSIATTAGIPLKVKFSVGGQQVSWSDEFNGSIPPGGMALLCGNRGAGGVNTWTASAVGTVVVEAEIDPDDTVDECVESNNGLTAQWTIYKAPLPNLALKKTVAVTSVEGPDYEGSNAVDGNMGTRWSSGFTDPQAITVDLGGLYRIVDITLYWEGAYAKEYTIKILDVSGAWTDVYHEANGQGGMEKVSLSVTARKLMVLGVQRATQYGYSLYELQVHGALATGVGSDSRTNAVPLVWSLEQNYPNPFNPSTAIRYQLSAQSFVTLKVFDILGREVATLVKRQQQEGIHSVRWDAAAFPSGVYVYKLDAGGFQASKEMVYLK
ncbi:MAG: glycoside hydrolase family 3 C-terminal domain-containing protein [Bacteroidota bacterium]